MTNTKPKLLIEQWLPIAAIGAECMRERGASSALPPLYFLHVWWARRPLTVSRAAILASLLPAYPVDGDPDVPAWPASFRKQFPTFDSYQAWFKRLLGIVGDPVQGRKLIEWAKTKSLKLKVHPYGYPRAFTTNPTEDQLRVLYEMLEWTWGSRTITFCDPMSGGGSIPFEALRYGLSVNANELNPVASVILRASLTYPAKFGNELVAEIKRYGALWRNATRKRLERFFPLLTDRENIFAYVWARTVACPITGHAVPLSLSWWVRKGSDPVAVQLVPQVATGRCRFKIVRGRDACAKAKPDAGTIKRGVAISPWTGEAIEGDYIKQEAKAGRMGQQLYAVCIKTDGGVDFRAPTEADESAMEEASKELRRHRIEWEAAGLLPTEPYPTPSSDMRPINFGMPTWADFYSPRQLLSHVVYLDELRKLHEKIKTEIAPDKAEALITYLAIALDKGADRNSYMSRWIPQRGILANTFDRHGFPIKWSFGEFDAAHNMCGWIIDQVVDSVSGIAQLLQGLHSPLFGESGHSPVDRLKVTRGKAQDLREIKDGEIRLICVDPPYYDNVQYAECSDYFYVWLRRSLGEVHPDLFGAFELTPKDEEAVANPARFQVASSTKRRELAEQDYENKMAAAFREMNRVLADDGVLTVMFTHKRVEAWDTLGTALISAGFKIDSSWPVHTEFANALHQAKKNAAASTILLTCRKRRESTEPAWWEDLKSKVRETAREKATEFQSLGIDGVDLYISTFGPVLSVISENWPVLTSESDPKTGDPLPLKPGDALDLARQEVVNLRKQGLLLGRAVEFDPITDWYLMAWDAFKAQEFPADEARKLALALGLDLERNIIREKRLVTKKSASVVLALPAARRKKDMVDEDAERFVHLIDALHTAMMIYDEEGSKACKVFVDRQGLRNDGRIKALVEALMNAIPTTRDKKNQFLRPEMTTLEAMRLLFWPDLPAPKEEEPPKIPEIQGSLFGGTEEVEDAEEEQEDEDE
ncbi:MAG: DUF1156 domain-containing protein [Planctomycetes bacterium]|nr:DUF1156 domain-containing protein [Planctomycetota bacterium]